MHLHTSARQVDAGKRNLVGAGEVRLETRHGEEPDRVLPSEQPLVRPRKFEREVGDDLRRDAACRRRDGPTLETSGITADAVQVVVEHRLVPADVQNDRVA
jgi:hypothetical protein